MAIADLQIRSALCLRFPSSTFLLIVLLVAAEHKWSKVSYRSAVFPSARWGHCTALVGDTLFAFGGYAGAGIVNELWALNLGNLTTLFHVDLRFYGFLPD